MNVLESHACAGEALCEGSQCSSLLLPFQCGTVYIATNVYRPPHPPTHTLPISHCMQWFAGVHLIDVLSVGRATLRDVCGSPAFAAPEAARQFAVAGRVARALSMMAPMPNPQASNTTACIDVLVASAGTDAMAAAGNGACACRQLATWILAVVGFALPLACQYLAEAAARRRFLRRCDCLV